MKKTIVSLIAGMTMFATTAFADYTFVVPQKPGGGTAVWTAIVAGELEKFLDGEKIKIQHIPGGRSLLGFNKWHQGLQDNEKTVMVSNGGNALKYLLDPAAEYNYGEYTSIGMMNLTIVMGRKIGASENNIRLAADPARLPEVMAMMMLVCGPDGVADHYNKCYNDNVTWVKGMQQGAGRLAYIRGELNHTRENPAAYKKHVAKDEGSEVWMTHGLLAADGSHSDDPNHPGKQFEILYEARWGSAPSGAFYDGYKLSKSFRDGMQKALWIKKDSPDAPKLIAALTEMSKNPESIKAIAKKVGNYDWAIGADGDNNRDNILSFTTESALKAMLKFQTDSLGYESIYKENIVND
jgi:hypothetical protein